MACEAENIYVREKFASPWSKQCCSEYVFHIHLCASVQVLPKEKFLVEEQLDQRYKSCHIVLPKDVTVLHFCLWDTILFISPTHLAYWVLSFLLTHGPHKRQKKKKSVI